MYSSRYLQTFIKEGFKRKYPKYSEEHYEEQVKKMLSCGNPEETCPHENGDGIYRIFVYGLWSRGVE